MEGKCRVSGTNAMKTYHWRCPSLRRIQKYYYLIRKEGSKDNMKGRAEWSWLISDSMDASLP